MRAMVLEKFGGLDSLVYTDLPEPEPLRGHVVIEIKAFGLNHAEMHMRRGEWAEAAKVIGIECVGLVKSCPGGEFDRAPHRSSWLQRSALKGRVPLFRRALRQVARGGRRAHDRAWSR